MIYLSSSNYLQICLFFFHLCILSTQFPIHLSIKLLINLPSNNQNLNIDLFGYMYLLSIYVYLSLILCPLPEPFVDSLLHVLHGARKLVVVKPKYNIILLNAEASLKPTFSLNLILTSSLVLRPSHVKHCHFFGLSKKKGLQLVGQEKGRVRKEMKGG